VEGLAHTVAACDSLATLIAVLRIVPRVHRSPPIVSGVQHQKENEHEPPCLKGSLLHPDPILNIGRLSHHELVDRFHDCLFL
jgi:hypothetical protein